MLDFRLRLPALEGHFQMRRPNESRSILFTTAAAVVLAAIFCACPLGMMAHAQMATMMGQDMPTQSLDGMCPLLCGVAPSLVILGSDDSVIGAVPVPFDLNLASAIRPIFHPPNLA